MAIRLWMDRLYVSIAWLKWMSSIKQTNTKTARTELTFRLERGVDSEWLVDDAGGGAGAEDAFVRIEVVLVGD